MLLPRLNQGGGRPLCALVGLAIQPEGARICRGERMEYSGKAVERIAEGTQG